jgi:hypothetical protein
MKRVGIAIAIAAIGGIGACSSDSNDGNDGGPPVSSPDEGGGPADSATTPDGGSTCIPTTGTPGALATFTPPADPGPGGILFAASGEVLALTGYPFPPVNPGDPVFVDGWDVHFTRLLTTIDKIKLSNNPDLSPGPWAVDLAHSDPSYLPGKGGAGEEAAPIASLKNQNRVGGTPGFATDGTRYAFGFDVVAATSRTCDGRPTMNVNLDAAGQADYQTMIAEGCAVFYVGTATFKGGTVSGFTDCNAGHENWPTTVNFDLCFKSPTTYVNCQNPDNDPAMAFPDEESERGIAFKGSQSVVGQVTIHTDHPFWDSVLHDSPAHFDQFAARVVLQHADQDAGLDAGAAPTVTLEATKGVDYTAYADALGNALDWRYCIAPDTSVHPQFNGPMAFDPQSVPHCTASNPATGLCDYEDFTTYDQSTQGHLNSDGLCFVKRNYPSPP